MPKNIFSFFILIFLFNSYASFAQKDFISEQKNYARVREAFAEKENIVLRKLKENNISSSELNILIVAYKAEQELIIYAKKKTETVYKKLSTYKICASSGELGPKRKQGDNQVPEGFYKINRFNPSSSYYLSLGLNYPNQSDKKKSSYKDLGGDIFIHGKCVTIGCMPMTDPFIREIYIYALYSKQNNQNEIPVYVFPFKMNKQNFSDYCKEYKSDKELIYFWTNIKEGYDLFEKNNRSLKYAIADNGDYLFH